MVNESTTGTVVEVAVTTPPVKEKKTRRPRKPKEGAVPAIPAYVTTEAPVAASPTRHRKRGEGETGAKGTSKAASKTPAHGKTYKLAATAVLATTGDEFADLIQLEEENKALRKALAEMLRLENAKLRMRLGFA